MASPPTCTKCGGVFVGYERSKELNVPVYVYFCIKCREREKEEAAERVEKEAA